MTDPGIQIQIFQLSKIDDLHSIFKIWIKDDLFSLKTHDIKFLEHSYIFDLQIRQRNIKRLIHISEPNHSNIGYNKSTKTPLITRQIPNSVNGGYNLFQRQNFQLFGMDYSAT